MLRVEVCATTGLPNPFPSWSLGEGTTSGSITGSLGKCGKGKLHHLALPFHVQAIILLRVQGARRDAKRSATGAMKWHQVYTPRGGTRAKAVARRWCTGDLKT